MRIRWLKNVRKWREPVSYTHLDVYKRQAYGALDGEAVLHLILQELQQ